MSQKMAKPRSPIRPPDARELDAEERMSRGELEALQLQRLQHTVHHAYRNVPHYRKKFDAHGVHPDDIRDLGDVEKLPFTTKQDLRDTYPFGMFAVPTTQVARVHASSGTTGRPTVVGYTMGDLENWAGLVARSLRAAGIRAGMKVQNAYGYGLFTGGLGAHSGIEKLGAMVIPVSGGQTARQAQLIHDFEPDAILCTPTYLLTIADAIAAQGIDPASTSLGVAVLGAEPWTNAMRSQIEERLGLAALDIYGLSEVMGPGVASECLESKDGPHIWEDHFLPEVIEPTSGKVLGSDESGELVFTSLTKEAFPIIRYRTRDLTRLLPGTARPAMRRMQKVTGRNDDMIILRGVNLFPTQIEELVLDIASLSPHFVLELSNVGYLDTLTARVEIREGVDSSTSVAVGVKLSALIKDRVGVRVEVVVENPGVLPRSEGKYQRLIDQRERL